jgi:peptidyl-tRNA hydrolase, PTH1 family
LFSFSSFQFRVSNLKLIVGLGNPGYEYHLTPHNLGFMAVDRLAEQCGVEIKQEEALALTAVTRVGETDVVLAKPQTYMNLSGLAVARLLHNYQLPVEELIVLVDEASLPLGRLRIRGRGSAGGHNGLKSIIGSLQNDNFVRVRMGVQPDRPVDDLTAHLLGCFRKIDLELVAEMVDRAAEAVRVIVQESLQQAMNRYNQRQPSPL